MLTSAELWSQGLITMCVGMGIVFTFLVILVFAIILQTKIVGFLNKMCPVAVVEQKTKKTAQDDSEIALAIAIANAQKM